MQLIHAKPYTRVTLLIGSLFVLSVVVLQKPYLLEVSMPVAAKTNAARKLSSLDIEQQEFFAIARDIAKSLTFFNVDQGHNGFLKKVDIRAALTKINNALTSQIQSNYKQAEEEIEKRFNYQKRIAYATFQLANKANVDAWVQYSNDNETQLEQSHQSAEKEYLIAIQNAAKARDQRLQNAFRSYQNATLGSPVSIINSPMYKAAFARVTAAQQRYFNLTTLIAQTLPQSKNSLQEIIGNYSTKLQQAGDIYNMRIQQLMSTMQNTRSINRQKFNVSLAALSSMQQTNTTMLNVAITNKLQNIRNSQNSEITNLNTQFQSLILTLQNLFNQYSTPDVAGNQFQSGTITESQYERLMQSIAIPEVLIRGALNSI